MSSIYAVSAGYDELEIVPNYDWKEETRSLVKRCLRQFCSIDMFPVDIKVEIANTSNPVRLVIISNKFAGKTIEIRVPRIGEETNVAFDSVLYLLEAENEVQKRVVIKEKSFEAYLKSPDEPEYVVKGEFDTRDALSLEQKVDDLIINLKLFSVLRVAAYTLTMALEMVLTVLQIEKTELKNLEIPNLKLKIKDFEIVEAFAQLKHGCSVYFDGEQLKYESTDFVLEMMPEKQTCNMAYKDFRKFSAERVEELYEDAFKNIVDLQHEIANFSN